MRILNCKGQGLLSKLLPTFDFELHSLISPLSSQTTIIHFHDQWCYDHFDAVMMMWGQDTVTSDDEVNDIHLIYRQEFSSLLSQATKDQLKLLPSGLDYLYMRAVSAWLLVVTAMVMLPCHHGSHGSHHWRWYWHSPGDAGQVCHHLMSSSSSAHTPPLMLHPQYTYTVFFQIF